MWIIGSPGGEESVLRGIQSAVGENVPLMGGSTADNAVEGKWFQFAGAKVTSNGVAVVSLKTSCAYSTSFNSGYNPTAHSGTVTACDGDRIVTEIDGQVASEVYDQWTGGAISGVLQGGAGGNVLALTTLFPLGRRVEGNEAGRTNKMYELLHPDAVTKDGGLSLFANVKEGDQITLMAGTKESLIDNLAHIDVRLHESSRESIRDRSFARRLTQRHRLLLRPPPTPPPPHPSQDSLRGDADL